MAPVPDASLITVGVCWHLLIVRYWRGIIASGVDESFERAVLKWADFLPDGAGNLVRNHVQLCIDALLWSHGVALGQAPLNKSIIVLSTRHIKILKLALCTIFVALPVGEAAVVVLPGWVSLDE